jgi:FG-GAP-like repeat
MADFDGDGDLDFAQGLAGAFAHPLLLIRDNQWPAPFTVSAASMPTVVAESVGSLRANDVDQDGDLDLYVGMGSQSGGSVARLVLNTPGAFVMNSLPVGSAWTTDVECADFDRDGDDDVLLVNAGGQHRLLSNDGGGSFTDVSAQTPTSSYLGSVTRAEVGDFDGDDDSDVVFSGFGAIDVWFGMRRQLAWSNVPAIGKPLDMELHGAPGSPWVLGVSTAQASIPLPGLGTLLIDPSTLAVLGQGVQNASGEAHKVFAVPSDPTLVGVEIYAQAVLGTPLRLSNLERVKFTDL